MARPAQFPPKISRHRSGQARVRYRGEEFYLGAFGSEEAARNYAELITRLAAGLPGKPTAPTTPTPTHPTGVTVAVVVSRWLTEEAPRYPDDGREVAQYRHTIRPLLRLFGNSLASEFDCNHLEQVQVAMATGTWHTPEERAAVLAKGRPLDWNCNVVNRRVVRIRTIWRWAERKKLVPHGSFAHLCTLPGLSPTDARVRHATRGKPAEMADVVRVVRHLPPVGQAMLLFQWWSGCRSAEVRLMRAGEVDTSGEVWIYTPGKHKMQGKGQSRVIAVGKRGQAVLRAWLAGKRAEEFVFPPSRHRCDGARDHYSDSGYGQLIRRAAEMAGLEGFHAYLCRHGARMRVTRSLGLEAARSVLGHRSIGTTAQYGDAVDLKAAMNAARKLG